MHARAKQQVNTHFQLACYEREQVAFLPSSGAGSCSSSSSSSGSGSGSGSSSWGAWGHGSIALNMYH